MLSVSSSLLALDMTPPPIKSSATISDTDIEFNVWSRAGDLTRKKLDASVVAFTVKEIREKFLTNAAAYADRFYSIDQSNYHERVVFTLLYEPFENPDKKPSSCDNTWFYYLAVEQAPQGKRFAISKLIISESGEILFGSGTSPYDWSETNCPIHD